MTPLDLLGHFAYLWVISGMVLLAARQKLGWLIRLVGEILWVIIGVIMGMSSIWVWGLVFIGIDVWGFTRWGNETKQCKGQRKSFTATCKSKNCRKLP